MTSFARLVSEKIEKESLSLRKVAREIGLDPSFFSKVLTGKRSPPRDEKILKKLAKVLGLNPTELIISTGKIPSELQGLMENSEFLNQLIDGRRFQKSPAPRKDEHEQKPETRKKKTEIKSEERIWSVPPSSSLSEDLL